MSNPFSGIITADHQLVYINMIDGLLEGFQKPCVLIYGDTLWTECRNCTFDSISNRSSGIYKTGGPIVFDHGVCPFCMGAGRIENNNEEIIQLVPLWNYKDWVGWDTRDKTRSPNGYVQTISGMDTITKIKRAKEIIINNDIAAYSNHRFTRDGEPTPVGLGTDAYIFTMWKSI